MTRQSTFKSKVRARMARTGERYAAARLALLAKATLPARPGVPAGYPTSAGVLTDLGALCAALAHAGVVDPGTGQPFTEARLYGLSGGPGFMSFVFRYASIPPMLTWTCRSFSLPGPVVQRALDHAGVPIAVVQTGSAAKAAAALDAVLDAGGVAHVAVDQARLPWLGLDPQWRGQWPRHVNVVGRDEDGFVVHDRSLWRLSADELAEARAGVRKAKHRLVRIAGPATADPGAATRAAVAFYVHNQRVPPKAGFGSNFGLAGLRRVAEAMAEQRTAKGWLRMFGSGTDAFGALLRIWECVQVELTPPAAGRPLFATFLRDAGHGAAAAAADASGEAFEALAAEAVARGGAALAEAVRLSEALDEVLRSGDPAAAERATALRRERAALRGRFDLDEAALRDAFAALADRTGAVLAREEALVAAVDEVVTA